MNKKARFIIILLLIGIICIVSGILLFVKYQNQNNYIETDGNIYKAELVHDEYIDKKGNVVDATYNLYVRYTVNGKKYEVVLKNKSGFKERELITISYNPNNPEQISKPMNLTFIIMLLIIGIVSFIGIVLFSSKSNKKDISINNQKMMFNNIK